MSVIKNQNFVFTYKIHSNEPEKIQFPDKELVWSLFVKIEKKTIPIWNFHNFSEGLLSEIVSRKMRRGRELHRSKILMN